MPNPEKGESEKDFLHRCIPYIVHEKDYEVKHAVAACYSIYRKEGTEAKSPKPEKKKMTQSKKAKLLLLHY